MGQLNSRFRSIDTGNGTRGIAWWCPGCEEMHYVPLTGPKAWNFNRDISAPTLSPSVKVVCNWSIEDGGPQVCHFFMKGGWLEFLNDCTHKLKNRKVPVPPLPKAMTY